ncbi:MAG: extracellular solute-binding protein [Deltaproteobacteria bacterium]|nr:extracellular solute-binding protein [Deltaproteobacteria bacterium]
MDRQLKVIAFFLLFIFFFIPQMSRGDLVSEAKKEGKLYWYTSMSVGDHTKYVALFNKKYPFIEVKVRRSGGERLITLIQTEHRAGKQLFDVTMGSRFAPSFIKSGIFAKYDSPEYKHLPVGTKSKEGYWGDAYVNGIGVSYNTEMIPKDKVPQKWEDLLNPMWKGKIAIDPRGLVWYDAVLRVMGKEKGLNFLTKFGKQDLQFRTGYTLKANSLIAGEYPLCLCYVHQIDRVKKKGAPVDWVKNEKLFVVNILHPILIASQARHPNAARLFMNFALSKEAQQLMIKLGRVGSSHPDVVTDVPKIVKFVPEDLSVYDRQKELGKEFERVLKVR